MDSLSYTYTMKQVSEETNIPPTTIRRWEKDFSLDIHRDHDNRRLFSNDQVEQLLKIKEMRDQNIPKDSIMNTLEIQENNSFEEVCATLPPPQIVHKPRSTSVIRNTKLEYSETYYDVVENSEFFEVLKKELILAVKEEISEGLSEFADSYKNEINRRDQLINENMQLRKELKKTKKRKGLFSF